MTINMADCGQRTDLGIESLSRNCPNITTINMNNCVQITDLGIESLSRNCPNIMTIHMVSIWLSVDR